VAPLTSVKKNLDPKNMSKKESQPEEPLDPRRRHNQRNPWIQGTCPRRSHNQRNPWIQGTCPRRIQSGWICTFLSFRLWWPLALLQPCTKSPSIQGDSEWITTSGEDWWKPQFWKILGGYSDLSSFLSTDNKKWQNILRTYLSLCFPIGLEGWTSLSLKW
jgi:hypothetical protein